MIKFSQHAITNTETGKKCRVHYSLDSHISGKPVVTLYAKSHQDSMEGIVDFNNDSDLRTDYLEKDRARFFENHPLYLAARAAAEARITKQAA